MRNITEEVLIEFGFNKNIVSVEESGDKFPYHYFIYSINDRDAMITCASDEAVDGNYYVEFYDMEGIGKFYDKNQLLMLLNILKTAEK